MPFDHPLFILYSSGTTGVPKCVVHGAGGADELTLAGENRVLPVGEAPAQDWDSESCGLSAAPVEALAGGEATENLGLLEKVLAGDSGPLRDAVVLNAAASLVVAGVSESAPEGVAAAQAALSTARLDYCSSSRAVRW